MNASLKREGKMVLMANVPAKLFKDAIDPYRRERGGKLWQRLVSLFRKQIKTNGEFNFTKFPSFDIYETYPLSRFFTVKSAISPDDNKSKLQVELSYHAHPIFKKVKDVDGYMLTVIGVFPDLKKKKALTTMAASAVQKLTGPITPPVLQLDLPPKAKEYVICLKLEACIKGAASFCRHRSM